MKLNVRCAFVNSLKLRTASSQTNPAREAACALLFIAAFALACNYSTFRTQAGMPPEAQALVDSFSKDVAAENYQKIYADAAAEWRQTTTPEQTEGIFTTLKEKLGGFKSRTVQTVRDQQNTGGQIPGHSLVVVYESAFERAAAMETFTLVERDGRWLLAGYFVNSNALK